MHENDRSATGFLEPSEFERVADEFFARPTVSIGGWERAIDAQKRIVGEVEAVWAPCCSATMQTSPSAEPMINPGVADVTSP